MSKTIMAATATSLLVMLTASCVWPAELPKADRMNGYRGIWYMNQPCAGSA